MNSYKTVDGETRADLEVKHSLFTASIKGITDFEDGLEFVKAVSKKFSDATHNCYALVCRTGEQKFSDDGEPWGTAGTPIMQVLKKNGLTDVVCVVTRYFGGIKLGVGGLGAAYTNVTKDAVAAAKIITLTESAVYALTLAYSDLDRLTKLTDTTSGKIKEITYGEAVNAQIAVPTENSALFIEKAAEAFGGKAETVLLSVGYEKY